MRIVSAIQASGRPHVGNYFGAIRQFVELEQQGELYCFIANLHSLTSVQDAAQLSSFTQDVALTLLACGLDPERTVLFRQGDVPEHTELFWILGSVVPLSHLERAHSYKDKIAHNIRPDFGLFAYPVLMAADILLYDAELVPVGKDQKQHVEFARDWATKFNLTFVKGYDAQDPNAEHGGKPGVFRLPEARILAEAAVVPGLDGQKMSKSYKNTLELFAEDAVIKKAIMGMKTDSTPVEAPKSTENNALYDLLRLLAPEGEFQAVDESFRAGGQGYGHYKKLLLDFFHLKFDPVRQRRRELESDLGEVERSLARGAERAREVASAKMKLVRQAVGL
jgi:tryptophanyl-tRNA synthetase